MRKNRINWQGRAFTPADSIEPEDLDRLADLARVDQARRSNLKMRFGRMAAIYVSHQYHLAERPTDAEVEEHLGHIRDKP